MARATQGCFWGPGKRDAGELERLPDDWAALAEAYYSIL